MNGEHDPPLDPRDDVAALIRLAGHRPAVPQEVADRVRAAAQERWLDAVRHRRRVHQLWTTALLAAAASIVLALALTLFRVGTTPPPSLAAARVESLVGSAWVGEPPRALPLGAALPIGAKIETGERDRVALRLPSGHSVRLDRASRIRILDPSLLALERGAVYVDSGSGAQAPPSAALSIRTALGDIVETGTQFEVRLGAGSVRVRVREGSVLLHAGDRVQRVDVATELEADGAGSSTRRELATYGPEWDWIAGITPLADLEGLSVRTFLERIAREGGRTLHFADDETAILAAATLLRGSVAGLSIDQALEAVLPTCGMVHRVDGGRLIVEKSSI